jgi:hypothetical protein
MYNKGSIKRLATGQPLFPNPFLDNVTSAGLGKLFNFLDP